MSLKHRAVRVLLLKNWKKKFDRLFGMCTGKKYYEQESIPIGCVPPAFLLPGGGSAQPPVGRRSGYRTPSGCRLRWMQTILVM